MVPVSKLNYLYKSCVEIKDTIYMHTARFATYIVQHLEIDGECQLKTKPYDKRDYFNFPIVNFLFLCWNIPPAPAYRVYIYI